MLCRHFFRRDDLPGLYLQPYFYLTDNFVNRNRAKSGEETLGLSPLIPNVRG